MLPMLFFDMRSTVSGLQHLGAAGLAAVEDHAHEPEVVARRRVEAAAAHLELGFLRDFQVHQRCERILVVALVDLGEALRACRG